MKNKLYTISCIIVCVCIMASVLTSCSKKPSGTNTSNSEETKKITVSQAEVQTDTDGEPMISYIPPETIKYTGNAVKPSSSGSKNNGDEGEKSTEKAVTITIKEPQTKDPVTVLHTTKSNPEKTTASDTTSRKATEKTTKKSENTTSKQVGTSASSSNVTAPSVAQGGIETGGKIVVLTKTSPVDRGGSASVFVSTKPDTEYTLEFFVDSSNKKPSKATGLGAAKTDSNGFVTWDFIVDSACEKGERTIVIKEKNGSESLTTTIIVK